MDSSSSDSESSGINNGSGEVLALEVDEGAVVSRKKLTKRCFELSSAPPDSLRGKLESMTPCGAVKYSQRVASDFGLKFTILLASCYIGVKGALHGIMVRVMLPYYKGMGLTGIEYQTAQAIAGTPWALKGFIGALSDAAPIGGYSKFPYMLISAVIGICGLLTLIFLPTNIAVGVQGLAALLFFAVQFQIATTDLLCEGKYAELMSEKPHTGSDVVTFVWTCIMVGKLLSASVVGPLADTYGTTVIFWIGLPFAVQVTIPVLLRYLPEKKTEVRGVNYAKIRKESNLFGISTLMATCALGVVVVSLLGGPLAQFIYAISVSGCLCVLSMYLMPRQMALCNLYMFFQDILHPTLSGAIDYWFTAEQTCVPGGPSLSYTYYTTWTAFVGIFASLLGVAIFQTFIKSWTFRKAYWVTTGIRCVASIVDYIIVKRWNIAIGINDKVMFMVGDAFILDLVEMMNFMPSVILISKLCPKNMESTVYAILAGFGNFGSTASKSIGVYILKAGGIDTTSCNFDSLPLLILICHFLLPLLAIPLTFFMIPNIPMTAQLIQTEDTVPLKPGKLGSASTLGEDPVVEDSSSGNAQQSSDA